MNWTGRDAAVQHLRELGLNDVEAQVYTFLLSTDGMTAYKIGKFIGKPTANVYKAVESLSQRGAVLIEDGDNRICRAVPAGDFLKSLEQQFLARTKQADEALRDLTPGAMDERVYRIETSVQVIDRCNTLIDSATDIVVVDAFPLALNAVRGPLVAAAKRGVAVFVEAYAPIEIEGAKVVTFSRGAHAVEQWRSQQLNIAVDGREHVLALLSGDLSEVYQAVWSRSLYLSLILHAGRVCEHTLVRLFEADRNGGTGDELKRILSEHQFFLNSEVPGQKELLKRFLPNGKTNDNAE